MLFTPLSYVLFFVLDDDQDQCNVSATRKDQGLLLNGEMIRLLDSVSESEVELFRRIYKSGLFKLISKDGEFEFGLKLILLGIEQVIKEQEK